MKIQDLIEIIRIYHLDENKNANVEIWENDESFDCKLQYVSDDRIVLSKDL